MSNPTPNSAEERSAGNNLCFFNAGGACYPISAGEMADGEDGKKIIMGPLEEALQ